MLARLLYGLIKRPVLLLPGLLVVLAVAIEGWQHMPVDLLPRLDVPLVNIITHLPGASPEDMELLVTHPIETQMHAINGVHRVASTSTQGISQISVQFDWGESVEDARQQVQARLSQLAGVLPQGVAPRLENIGTSLQEVTGFVISGPVDAVDLSNAVRYRLLPRLSNVEGVSFVDILGGEQRAFIVTLQPAALMRLHLKLQDVADALAQANRIEVAGFASQGGREWLVRTDGRALTLSQLGKLVVTTSATGRPILLSEVARLQPGWVPKHYTIHGAGKPAVALLVRKQPGASTLAVVQRVDRAMTALRTLLPAGAQVQKFYNQAEIIARAKQEIMNDIWVGAILVVAVLYLFLGSFRPTLIVALTIPVTLLVTLAGMHLLGLSLNVITMTALALAVGMVVDDAIIVAENINRHSHTAHDAAATVVATVEIAGPDASGTLTTVSAFLPLLLMSGLAALFLRPFGWTISIALLVSLLVSLTLVPALSAHRLFHEPVNNRHPGERILGRLSTVALRMFEYATAHRKLLTMSTLGFVVLAAIAAASGRIGVLPPLDEGSVLVEYIMPPGTSLAESNRIADQLEQIALAQPEVSTVYRRTGSPLKGYQIEGPHRGELMIKFIAKRHRQHSAVEIMDRLRHLYAGYSGMSFLYHQPTQEKMDESFSGLPALFGVTIYGDNTDTLITLAAKVEALLKGNDQLSNIINNTKVRTNQLSVRLRQGMLVQYGLQPEDVINAVRAAGLGMQATRIVHQQLTIPVLLRVQGVDLERPDTLAALPVPLANGTWVPLGKLADIEPAAVAATITRLNGQREVTLLAEAEGNMVVVARQVEAQLATLQLPAGYSAAVTGQYPVMIDAALGFLWAALAAAGLIYLIMVLQFGSWRQPLAILGAIPLSLAGGLLALRLSGQQLDISIAMGALTLIGIAVNNGIVLVDFANRRVRAGASALAAWQQAIQVRLRPVLLTVITTMASLLPIAVGLGGASDLFKGFAIMVTGGLLAAMAGTLILLPVLLLKPVAKAVNHF